LDGWQWLWKKKLVTSVEPLGGMGVEEEKFAKLGLTI
jgi:hypothetical protein